MPDTCSSCRHLTTHHTRYIGAMVSHYQWCERRGQQASAYDAACQHYEPKGEYPLGGPERLGDERSVLGMRREQ